MSNKITDVIENAKKALEAYFAEASIEDVVVVGTKDSPTVDNHDRKNVRIYLTFTGERRRRITIKAKGDNVDRQWTEEGDELFCVLSVSLETPNDFKDTDQFLNTYVFPTMDVLKEQGWIYDDMSNYHGFGRDRRSAEIRYYKQKTK